MIVSFVRLLLVCSVTHSITPNGLQLQDVGDFAALNLTLSKKLHLSTEHAFLQNAS